MQAEAEVPSGPPVQIPMETDGTVTIPEPAAPGAVYDVPVPAVLIPKETDGTITIPEPVAYDVPVPATINNPQSKTVTLLPGCSFQGCTINVNMMAQNK